MLSYKLKHNSAVHTRVVIRWNVDPRVKEYPYQSPYSAFNANPIIYADPTGEGGELVVKSEIEAKLVINVVLYSDVVDETKLQALKTSAQKYARENISNSFMLKTINRHSAPFSTSTKYFEVEFEINVEVKSYKEAVKEASANQSVANNYFYVGDFTDENGAGFTGGKQEGNAGYISSEASGRVLLHEIISSLEIYKSDEPGNYVETLHGHNPDDRKSILHGAPEEGATFTKEDAAAFGKKGITTPRGNKPTSVGTLTNQTYSSRDPEIIEKQ